MRPVVLFDTFSLFFRAYFALPDMRTSSGRHTGALFGFSTLLLKLLREEQPEGIAFALDAPERTFRHERFADYKAQRERAPTPLLEQFADLDRLLAATGAPALVAPGYEADDVLATLAREISRQHEVLVVSGDRDLLQTVGPRVQVLYAGQRGKSPRKIDEDAVRARFGIAPSQLPTFIALVGDTSDNIPGIPGVGPRIAARWIAEHDSMQSITENAAHLKPARLATAVTTRASWLRQAEDLARLRTDVPLPATARFGLPGPSELLALRELCVELEFKSLLSRLDQLRAG